MRSILILPIILFSINLLASNVKDKSPEEFFIMGTEHLKPESKSYDPEVGLSYLMKSASYKYEHAPFGLCAALSLEKKILDLETAYTWCYVASKIGNKNAPKASKRMTEIEKHIESKSGEDGVVRIKKLARGLFAN